MREKITSLTDSQWQFVEKHLKDNRKRKHSRRIVFDAILWLNSTGSQWRNLRGFPFVWQVAYYYFRKWQKEGLFFKILRSVVIEERKRQGREAQPSVVATDSQSVKKGMFIHFETGIDGNKKVNGRKRHLIVDVLGLPLAIGVSAANRYDGNEGVKLLPTLQKATSRLELIRVDNTYKGEFVQMAEKEYSWRVEFGQKPESVTGFVPQKGRWQIERSFAWLNPFRRLDKDHEKTIDSSVSFISLAFISILLGRIP